MDESKAIKLRENIYGHLARTDWFKQFITKEQTGLEFGCGTGVMVTSRLQKDGYDTWGIDLDCPSIEKGKEIFRDNDLDDSKLLCKDLNEFDDNFFDYVIATEVFEHIEASDIDLIVELIKQKTKPDGILIITVPNGYGSHEIEEIFWKKLGGKKVMRFLFISQFFNFFRKLFDRYVTNYPTTLSSSPHVRRFTLKSIKKLATDHGFEVMAWRGSALIAGGFSDMIFSGNTPIMWLSRKFGEWFPAISSGFYLATRNKK